MNINDILKRKELFDTIQKTTFHDAAYYSLMISIESYFNTYNILVYNLDASAEYKTYDGHKYVLDENKLNKIAFGCPEYTKNYINISIHLQHFLELTLKKVLEDANAIYAIKTNDILLISKILSNEHINNAEKYEEFLNSKNTVEFSEALSRLKNLKEDGVLSSDIVDILYNNRALLESINNLRNATAHKGRKIMNYTSLDKFFTQNILPFIKEIVELPSFEMYKQTFDEIDILEIVNKLIELGQQSKLDFSNIALYKELGRGKFNINRRKDPYIDEDSESIISAENHLGLSKMWMSPIKTKYICPCCSKTHLIETSEVISTSVDELGDEMSGYYTPLFIPEYTKYLECPICNLLAGDFILQPLKKISENVEVDKKPSF